MQTTDDRALLREYAETGREEAFDELLRRHVNLVYSAALRRLGTPEHAEEITQAVFVILARKARSLRRNVILSGWLYRATSLAAANLIRAEMRRKRREKESLMQSQCDAIENDSWAQIAPILDDAMDGLNRRDREAIVMRFFEGKTMQEVGNVCGISENAAEKRAYHGLERLRKFFSKRGVVLTGAIIAGAIAANGVQAAPVGLVTKIGVVAAQGGAMSTLVASTLKLMLGEKLKLLFACGASAAVVIAAVPITWSVLTASASKSPTVHLEGTVTEYRVDENGTTNFGTASDFRFARYDVSGPDSLKALPQPIGHLFNQSPPQLWILPRNPREISFWHQSYHAIFFGRDGCAAPFLRIDHSHLPNTFTGRPVCDFTIAADHRDAACENEDQVVCPVPLFDNYLTSLVASESALFA